MNATFIGVDLAWRSESSGVAVLRGNASGAATKDLRIIPTADVSDYVVAHSTSNTFVAIDAPLVVTNETGQRICETEVGRSYGARHAFRMMRGDLALLIPNVPTLEERDAFLRLPFSLRRK
jgi:predicted RNase H-like nuclease